MDDHFLLRTKKEYEDQVLYFLETEQFIAGLEYLDSIANKVLETVWLLYYKGVFYNALEQPHLALPFLLKALQQTDGNVSIYSELGWAYNRLDEFDLAINNLESAVSRGREDYWVDSELAYSYLKKGMVEEAIIYLENAIEQKDDDIWALGQLATAYLEVGKYEQTNYINKKLFALEAIDASLLEEIININELLESYDDQKFYLDYMIDNNISINYAYCHLGIYYNLQGKHQEAVDALLSIDPINYTTDTLLELGYGYRGLNKYEISLKYYEEAYLINSNNQFLLTELVFIYGELDMIDKKIEMLDSLVALGRKDIWVHLSYVRIYLYDQINFEKARLHLAQIDEVEYNDEYYFLEIEYLHLTNQFNEAIQKTTNILCNRGYHLLEYYHELSFNDKMAKKIEINNLDRVYEFYNGRAYVEKDGVSGFIDDNGQLAIDFIYNKDTTKRKDTYMFFDAKAVVTDINGYYGVIDVDGNVLVDCIYDNVIISDNYIKMELAGKSIFKSDSNEILVTTQCQIFSEGLLAVKENNKWGYINQNKETIINYQYNSVSNFKDGYAIVENDTNSLIIDQKNNVLVVLDKCSIKYLNEGYFAYYNGGWIIFDIHFNKVSEHVFDEVGLCHENMILVKKYDKYAFLNITDKTLGDFIYEDAIIYFDGLACVGKNNLYGMIDKVGNEVIPFCFDTVTILKGGIIIVGIGYRYGLMNSSGKLLTPIMFQMATLPVDDILSVTYAKTSYILDTKEILK